MFPAVIVAAGVASRLRPYSLEKPKSLMELEPGLTILQFVLERLRRAGLAPVYVVTRRELGKYFRELPAPFAVLTVDEEEFGNLYSVYTALRHVQPPFLVAMSDHIFEYEILRRLLSKRPEKAFVICLDRKPSASEVQEGLKVRLREGRVVEVGKGIETRYGIDTGLILVGEKARHYIEKVIEEKGPAASIGDALSLAAKDGEVDYVDVTGLLWKDIDTPEDLAKARLLYKRILVRDHRRATAGPATWLFVRPLSMRAALSTPPRALRATGGLSLLVAAALASLVLTTGTPSPIMLLSAYALALLADYCWILNVLAQGQMSSVSLAAELVAEMSIAFTVFSALLPSLPPYLVAPAGVLLAVSSALPAAHNYLGRQPTVFSLVSDPVLKYTVSVVLLLLGFGGLAVAYWVLAGFLPLYPAEPLRYEPREVFPRLSRRKAPLKRRLEVAVASGFKLAISLTAISLVQAYIGDMAIGSEVVQARVGDVLSMLALLLVIYYGYRVLQGLVALVDAVSARLAEALKVTESVAKHIGFDILYVAVLALALTFLPSSLRTLPEPGGLLSRAVALMLVALLVFFLYDLAKVVYRTFEDALHSLLDKVVKVVSEREA